MTITVYTSPNCPACVQVKNYLAENEAEYTEVDVSDLKNIAKVQEVMTKAGTLSVPVTVVEKGDDIKYITGYQKSKLEILIK